MQSNVQMSKTAEVFFIPWCTPDRANADSAFGLVVASGRPERKGRQRKILMKQIITAGEELMEDVNKTKLEMGEEKAIDQNQTSL